MPDEKIDQKRPAGAVNELHAMQQRLVDDTVDDSFPASDPPAWTTTGSKSVAAQRDGEHRDEGHDGRNGAPEDRAGGGTWQRATQQASRFAQDAYRRGGEYVEQGWDALPRAGAAGRNLVRPVGESPVWAALVAGAVGYGIAWWIHGRSERRSGRASHRYDRRFDHRFDEDLHGQAWPSGDSPKPHGDKLPNTVKLATDNGDRY